MYNYDDIMARLRAGEDSEKIAQEMVDTLNRANKDFVDEQNKVSAVAAQKAEMVEDMLDMIEDYVRQFHAGNPIIQMFDDLDKDTLDVNELVASIDEAIDQYAVMANLMNSIKADLGKAMDARMATQRPTGGKITPNPDALGAFLKANGLA